MTATAKRTSQAEPLPADLTRELVGAFEENIRDFAIYESNSGRLARAILRARRDGDYERANALSRPFTAMLARLLTSPRGRGKDGVFSEKVRKSDERDIQALLDEYKIAH